MRTIVGSSTDNTKGIEQERLVTIDSNLLATNTNVSQYGAGGGDIEEIETSKHFASEAEKAAKEAATSAASAENYYTLTKSAADGIKTNVEESSNHLTEIRKISTKVDGQEVVISKANQQVLLNTTISGNYALSASQSAKSAEGSEFKVIANSLLASNSAVSAKESEINSKNSEDASALYAERSDHYLAQTESVYNKTINDVTKEVKSFLKDKGGFNPSSGLPEPDTWLDILGNRNKFSCLWVCDSAGTILETGTSFNEGDILIYNAIMNRYGRFSGELVSGGGGGGGGFDFFSDVKLASGFRLLGVDSLGSNVELIKLVNDIVEAGDKTKTLHLLTKDVKSANVCVANSSIGFTNYPIYHTGNKPTTRELNVYSKGESDNTFLNLVGTKTMTGPLSTTDTIYIKTQEVYHPGNKPTTFDINAVSLNGSESIAGTKTFTESVVIENNTPYLLLRDLDSNKEVSLKVIDNKFVVETPTSRPFELNFEETSVLLSNPTTKTIQGTTGNSLVRKDYLQSELAKKLDGGGDGSINGDLVVNGKIIVKGVGSLFADVNTIGELKENNIRVYSPSNKPNAIDVGALPSSGGNIGGSLHVRGDISTDGFITEKGVRVYSPNNKPEAGDFDVYSRGEADTRFLSRLGDVVIDGSLVVSSEIKEGSVRVYSPNNKPTAADVGAVGLDVVYTKIQSDDLFWHKDETVYKSFQSDWVGTFSKNVDGFKDVNNFRSYNVSSTQQTGFPSTSGSGIFQGYIPDTNNQGWSLFHQAGTSFLSFGKQKLDGSGFDWFKLYHENNKQTSEDIQWTDNKTVKDNLDDLSGFTSALLTAGKVVPSGNPDTPTSSERVTAIQNIVNDKTDFTVVSGGGILEINKRYLITDAGTYTLPNTTGLIIKNMVKLYKVAGVNPTIIVEGGNKEVINFYQPGTGILVSSDSSVTYNIFAPITFIYNTNWEL